MQTGQVDRSFWRSKRVFITGHTGFKGSWVSFWLTQMGARVAGYALAPETEPAAFEVLGLADDVEHQLGDVRDGVALAAALRRFAPEVVLHLAAQPLVRRSYREPVQTYETNVMGTVHLLQAVRACPTVKVVVVVTTDKVYENREWAWGYREIDALGGYDPYASSKACAEIVTGSWRRSFFHPSEHHEHGVVLASARAGNVLGGGDWREDRVIPDAVRAFCGGQPVRIRSPRATRPWQHVLEPLSGYLALAQACHGDPSFAEAFNFGPRPTDVVPVREVITRFVEAWGEGAAWEDASSADDQGPHEAATLKLDCSHAEARLGWRPRTDLQLCIELSASWYRAHRQGADRSELRALTRAQIERFEQLR